MVNINNEKISGIRIKPDNVIICDLYGGRISEENKYLTKKETDALYITKDEFENLKSENTEKVDLTNYRQKDDLSCNSIENISFKIINKKQYETGPFNENAIFN